MPFTDRMIDYMDAEHFERFVIENDRVCVFYRADGSSVPTTELLDITQIKQILDEILPALYQPLMAAGAPFQFQYPYRSGAVDISVLQTKDTLRVTIGAQMVPLVPLSPATDPLAGAVATAALQTVPVELAPPAAALPGTDGATAVPSVGAAIAESPVTTPLIALVEPAPLPVKLDFPTAVPRALQWPESRLRLYCALAGILLGLLTSVLIFLIARKGSMLGQMFNLREIIGPAAIPIAISSMFFWAACLCVVRWYRLRALEQLSRKSLLLEACRFLGQANLAELSQALAGPTVQASPLLRRLQAVIQQWLIRPNLQDADVVLQQHIANDQEAVHVGYNLVRTFIWALPVLGLIGTVIGISLAVGGFAQFLGGDIEDVKIVKQNLVGVTGGLSFAFLITLQGLLSSLLVMLTASALQTREEKMYAAIQQETSDIFLPRLQQVAPEAKLASEAGELVTWRETLQKAADNMLEVVGNECTRLVEVVEIRQTLLRDQISQWSTALRRETEAGAVLLGAAVSKVGTEIADSSNDFLERLARVREALDQQSTKLEQTAQAQLEGAAKQHAEILAAMSEQAGAVRETAGVLAQLTETTATALAAQATLQTAMRQLGEANVERTFTGFIAALAGQSDRLQTTTEAVTGLANSTQAALASQAALQAAMRQMQEGGLEQNRAATAQHAATVEAMAQQTSALRETAASFAVLTETTKTALASQATLQAAIRQLSEANIERTFTGYVDALSGQSRDVQTMAEAVRGLTTTTAEVLAAQGSLQIAIRQLRDTGFDQTLAAFRDSLVSLTPVLASFREPFVLQAVPVASKAPGG